MSDSPVLAPLFEAFINFLLQRLAGVLAKRHRLRILRNTDGMLE